MWVDKRAPKKASSTVELMALNLAFLLEMRTVAEWVVLLVSQSVVKLVAHWGSQKDEMMAAQMDFL